MKKKKQKETTVGRLTWIRMQSVAIIYIYFIIQKNSAKFVDLAGVFVYPVFISVTICNCKRWNSSTGEVARALTY